MIIKDVKLTRTKTATVLSANCRVRKLGWDTIYFSLPGAQKHDYIYEDASPFAAALLLPAMRQGEDLIIKGSISKELYDGMQAIMDRVAKWDIGLKRITIKAESLTADQHQPRRTGSFFSGGVDSFYTYLKHKSDTVKSERVDSLVLVNGFDISLQDTEVWNLTRRNIAAVAKAEKVELLAIETNVRAVLEPLLCDKGAWEHPWDFLHGGCLAAIGLFLRGQYHRIYIPSTYSADDQRPRGIGPDIDKHWSTEELTFIHDGTEATRLNKVRWQIARSPVALKHLRVCFMNKKGAYNCGVCDKCLRTMVNLYIAGVLEQTATFPPELDLKLVANVSPDKSEDGDIFHNENLQALKEQKRAPELQAALRKSLKKGEQEQTRPSLAYTVKTKFIRQALRKALYADYAYAGGHIRGAVVQTSFGHKIF